MSNTIKVLVIEDSEADAALVIRQLRKGGYDPKYRRIDTREQLKSALSEQWDIIIADFSMPDFSGLEALNIVRRLDGNVPFIIVSGTIGEDTAVAAMKAGAHDYVMKGNMARLSAAVDRELKEAEVRRQREDAVAALRESEQRLKLVLEGGNEAFWDWDTRSDYVFFSDRWAEMVGFTASEIEPKFASWKKLIHPEDSQRVMQSLQDHLNGLTRIFESEHRVITRTGTPIHVMDRAKVVSRNGQGDPLRLAGTRTDVTELKKFEKALRESEQLFRAVFETAQDCMYIKDITLKYVSVNPAMETYLGLPASKVVGRTDDELRGNESHYLKEADERVLGGDLIEGEFTRKVNGTPVTYHEIRVPLRDGRGRIVSLCGIMRDITSRKTKEFIVTEEAENYPSEMMRSVLNKVRIAAERQSTILLLGESGSGKDHLARYIHSRSRRATGPFFSINCAAVAPELAESELFGHERGAFTGAYGRKRGLLELAEGGTLLLNEIGELSPALQAKLLTFLDTRQFTRVGGEKNVRVDARLIAATNRDLEEEVRNNRFRKDLYYRLNVVSITMPPLRSRREDIPVLVKEILIKLKKDLQLQFVPDVEPKAINALLAYSWPGNIRELRNVLERGIIVSDGPTIKLRSLALEGSFEDWSYTTTFPKERSLNDLTKDLKASLVNEALRRSRRCREDAAKLLGISRHSLKHYMKSLDIHDQVLTEELDGNGRADL